MRMRTKSAHWIVRLLLVAIFCIAAFTAQIHIGPVAKAQPNTTCNATWYKVVGPGDGPIVNGASVRAWGYAYKDVISGKFCGLLHSSIDWSQSSGHCNTFYTGVYDDATGRDEAVTSVYSCAASGSLQSTFYRPSVHSTFYPFDGWLGVAGGFARTTSYIPYY